MPGCFPHEVVQATWGPGEVRENEHKRQVLNVSVERKMKGKEYRWAGGNRPNYRLMEGGEEPMPAGSVLSLDWDDRGLSRPSSLSNTGGNVFRVLYFLKTDEKFDKPAAINGPPLRWLRSSAT